MAKEETEMRLNEKIYFEKARQNGIEPFVLSYGEKPSSEGDSVSLIIEFLRIKLIESV